MSEPDKDRLLLFMTAYIKEFGPQAVNEAFVQVCLDFAGDARREGKQHKEWQWSTIAGRATNAATIGGEPILRQGEPS